MRYHCCTCSRCRRYTCWLLLDTSWYVFRRGILVRRYQIRVRLSEEHHRRLDEPSGLLGTFGAATGKCIPTSFLQLHSRGLRRPASSSSPGVDLLRWSSGVFAAIRPRVHFLKRPARKAFVRLRHARLRSSAACKASGLSLYRNLRRPFSFPSEERVGSPP